MRVHLKFNAIVLAWVWFHSYHVAYAASSIENTVTTTSTEPYPTNILPREFIDHHHRNQQQQEQEPFEEQFSILSSSRHPQHMATYPTGIHLAFRDHQCRRQEGCRMIVQFTTSGRTKGGTPIAMYGTTNPPRTKVEGLTHTYTSNDMCSPPANQSLHGLESLYHHVVEFVDLIPSTTYYYKVGIAAGQGAVWSNIQSFTSPPRVGDDIYPFSYAIYGDQGGPCTSNEMSNPKYHDQPTNCKDAEWITNQMVYEGSKENLPIRSVHHIGGLSYARGISSIWEEWIQMISTFAQEVPLMVAVGNVEYDHTTGGENGKDPSGVTTPYGYKPKWGNFGNDSGGECGVPISQRFQMPESTLPIQLENHRMDAAMKFTDHSSTTGSRRLRSKYNNIHDETSNMHMTNIGTATNMIAPTASDDDNNNSSSTVHSNGVFWYSYEYATVHTTVLSSEHDLSYGSPQYRWLQADFQSVNRSLTPWLIVEIHRPLYSALTTHNNAVGIGMRLQMEHLLYDYSADVVLSAHLHTYYRTCDGLYQAQCTNDSGHSHGPTHITIGTGGAPLDHPDTLKEHSWIAKHIPRTYGYGRITIVNSTSILFEFVAQSIVHNDQEHSTNDNSTVLDHVWIHRSFPRVVP